MIYELAIVEDRGSYYQVQGVTKNTLDNLANRDERYLKLSYISYKLIDEAINCNKLVRIKKTLLTDEVLPGELDIIENDSLDIQYIRDSAFIKVRSLVTPEMTKESGFTLYNFIMKNNELSDKGYFITEANREEKYIEIIETADESLIELLESYLETKDKLERASSMVTRLEKFKKDISLLDNESDIVKHQDDFISNFYKA